jgi:beta-galactosidase GanA
MPRTAPAQGRYELLVDGKPYLVLGAHVNSSSDSPAKLPQVSPAVGEMRADTVAMPIAWEQLAPEEGTFDFSFLERQARAHGRRVVRLGFGTAVFVLLSDDSAVHRQTIRRDPVDRV